VQGASDAGLIPMFLPDYQPVGRTDLREPFEKVWHHEIDPVRGLTVVEIMNAIHAGEITGMYIEGEIPRCPTPTCSTRARRWQNSSIWWCRTCSSPKPRFMPK
jgi:formate dehydrogenase major subunit